MWRAVRESMDVDMGKRSLRSAVVQSDCGIVLAPGLIPSGPGARSPALARDVTLKRKRLRDRGALVAPPPGAAGGTAGPPERGLPGLDTLPMAACGSGPVLRKNDATLLKYEAILNNASVGISFTRDRVFQHANPAFEEMFGWPPGGLNGQSGIVVWGSEEEYQELGRAVGPILSQGKSVELERKMKRRDGTLFWCRLQARPIDPVNPVAGGTIWIIEDITERRHAVERLRQLNEELEQRVRERTQELAAANTKLKSEINERRQAEGRARHLSLHDALTGLPNRRLLHDRLAQLLAQARREGWSVAVMFIDLDRFKTINDSFGHATGDAVLREMAARLTESLRESDTVSRVGGDEFVLVLPHIQAISVVSEIASKLMAKLSVPCTVGGRELHVTTSIGISIFPDDGDDAHRLLSHADAAMYHAKETGRRNYRFYTSTISETAQTRLGLENDLHHALERSEFVLHFQPRVYMASRAICGAEALLRWNHPQSGLIGPGEFIPVAEESGLIIPIGEWVIGEACRQMKCWQDAGLPVHPVSVNLSARQFSDGTLTQRVADALAKTGLQPALLELEITESTLMENTDETLRQFAGLKRLGVKLAIDDFGTGFSSLAYLKRFHVDILKIDQSFVRDISTDPDDAAIVRAIISLAKSLQLRVVAEGVETREQVEFLTACGCQEAQGFFFGRPCPAEELEAVLASGQLCPCSTASLITTHPRRSRLAHDKGGRR
ncbi:MAG: sensor domain-containing protein [Casimicrobiaceae bacterium]